MSSRSLSLTASAANLQRLNYIRLILLSCIGVAFSYIQVIDSQDINGFASHIAIVTAYTIIALLTIYRLRKLWPVTDLEYFFHLIIDIFVITSLLYISGGASNPFVSFFLVPLCISAAILPWRYTWVIAGLSLIAYSLMLFYFEPLTAPSLEHMHGHHEANTKFGQHIIGMWFNFTLSAVLITYFVVKMANTLRQKEFQWLKDREDTLRDEQILAVATLAAGTAHELGTPLSTMTVLLDEMAQDTIQSDSGGMQLGDDIQLLQQQVVSCRHILKSLVHTAQTHSLKQRNHIQLTPYIQQLLSHWQVLRPSAQFTFNSHNTDSSPTILVDSTLEQAIINILNNAADANPNGITIDLDWSNSHYTLKIHDQGPGIDLAIIEQLGKPFISTKGKGLGLGLFLSHATIHRYGGSITLYNHSVGGTVANMLIPLADTEASS